MSHLYGDSTPFPYDVDYIDLSRHAVECAVQLLSAQHAILAARERAESFEQARAVQTARLSEVTGAVESALDRFSTTDGMDRIATRLLDCVRSTCADELSGIERQAVQELEHARTIATRSGEAAQRSLEAFLLRHDLPGTELGLTWSAVGEQGYTGQVAVQTPFGVNAAFSLAIPTEHQWSRAPRVSELASGLEVHVPQQAGWLSKRVEMALIKLDKMFVSSLEVDGQHAEFRMRKGAVSGVGYRVLVELQGTHRVLMQPVAEDGSPDADPPLVLDGDDSAQMFRLYGAVIESLRGVGNMRRGLLSANFDGQPLDEFEWPGAVAERLVLHIAPVVREIGRRSGAPGELVLRREVGGGRREEMYVTKTSLYEKVLVLPPARRSVFDALNLTEPTLPVAPIAALESFVPPDVVPAPALA